MKRFRPWQSFRANPSSLRWATAAIVTVTGALVCIGALVIRIFDAREYPTFGDALWFTLQTITTVGYGDDTPVTTVGRVVASVVMLTSIGLITVITAIITSLFIDSARSSRRESADEKTAESLARIEASLAATQARLDQIENASASQSTGSGDAT